jgi:predicted N-acyltransferase
MPEQLRIEEDVERLPAAEWHRLVCGHPALRLEVLRAMAATAVDALPVQIFLLTDDTGIAAAAVCEQVAADQSPSALDYLLYGRAQRIAPAIGVSTRPTLLFRTPVGTESAVVLRSAEPAEQRRLLDRLLDEIEAHAAGQQLGIAFIGVFADEEFLGSALRARNYLDSDMQPTSRLQIEWHDFDGYARHLQEHSQNSARTVRRERSRNGNSGVSIRRVQCGSAEAEALFAFTRDHYRRKNGTDPHIGQQFLPRLCELLGDDFLALEAVRDGHRIGMLGAVRSGSVGWVAWFGLDRNDGANDFTYANLVFYHLADVAASLGLKTLLYGTLALDAKRRRGCQIIRSRLFYRPHRPLARLLARAYFPVHRAWFSRKLG